MENFMSWSFYHIFYIDLFQALTFILQKISLNWQNCENKSLRELTFCFESGFKNIPNNVDLYNVQIPIQHDVYVSANYSVSSYLNL